MGEAVSAPPPPPGFTVSLPPEPPLPRGLIWGENSHIATDPEGRRYARVPVPERVAAYRRNFGLQPTHAQVTPADTPTPEALPAEAYALLDTIAGTESAGRYDVMYGQRRFRSYADHPRQPATIERGPNKGRKSSAAGRYQFIQDTWDDQARKLGLGDFSPASQDQAAWNLARETYGRGLMTELRSGDPERLAAVGRALRGQWTSLPGGIEAGTSESRFARAYADNYAHRTGARALAALPVSASPPPPGFTVSLPPDPYPPSGYTETLN